MEIIGLDIGTSYIKALSIKKAKTPQLVKYATVFTKGISSKLYSESTEDTKELANFISDFLLDNDMPIRKVTAVLPDHRIFTKVISLPDLEGKDFQQALNWEAEQYLPEALSDVYLKYSIIEANAGEEGFLKKFQKLGKKGNKKDVIDVLLVASPKNMVDKYVDVLNKAGLEPIGLEPSSTALVRSLTFGDKPIPTMIVDFGYNKVNLSLVSENYLRFTRTINFAISTINKAISQELDVSIAQANEYLYTYGVDESALSGKLKELIMPVIKIIIDELKKSIEYAESRRNLMGSDNKKIKRIILTGGGAVIPDILVLFAELLGREVEFANPWEGVDTSVEKDRDRIEKAGPLFASAVGVALKYIG